MISRVSCRTNHTFFHPHLLFTSIWCITSCNQSIFYSNYSLNFLRTCKYIDVIGMIRYIFDRVPVRFNGGVKILCGLGLSLKCACKVILYWLDKDTSSYHVLISHFFWRSPDSPSHAFFSVLRVHIPYRGKKSRRKVTNFRW